MHSKTCKAVTNMSLCTEDVIANNLLETKEYTKGRLCWQRQSLIICGEITRNSTSTNSRKDLSALHNLFIMDQEPKSKQNNVPGPMTLFLTVSKPPETFCCQSLVTVIFKILSYVYWFDILICRWTLKVYHICIVY